MEIEVLPYGLWCLPARDLNPIHFKWKLMHLKKWKDMTRNKEVIIWRIYYLWSEVYCKMCKKIFSSYAKILQFSNLHINFRPHKGWRVCYIVTFSVGNMYFPPFDIRYQRCLVICYGKTYTLIKFFSVQGNFRWGNFREGIP